MDFDDPQYDANFEFDAPRYYDFEFMNEGTPGDRWFDTAPDGPGCKADKSAGVVLREPLKTIQQEAAPQPPETATQNRSSNLVTSWGQKATKRVTHAGTHDAAGTFKNGTSALAATARSSAPADRPTADADARQPRTNVSAAAAAAAPAADSRQHAGPAAHGHHQKARKSLGVGARRICSSSGDGARTEPPVTRSMSRLGLNLCSPVPEGSTRDNCSPPMTRSRKCATAVKGKGASSRTNSASMQKLQQVLQPKVVKPIRSIKPLTLPDDFELETDKRLAAKAAAAHPDAQQAGKSPFKSLAEKVREFQCKTPLRFRSKTEQAAPVQHLQQQLQITDAKSPFLMTSKRARPSHMKSQQQTEAEELDRLRKEQFRAKPLDVRVLTSSGQLGVPKVGKPKPTEPQPFNLRSDSRAKARQSHEHPSMEQAATAAKFKAQPLNRSILDGPTFKPHMEKQETTVPKSPLLRTKLRSHTAAPHAGRLEQGRPASSSRERALSASTDRPLSGGSIRGAAAAAGKPHPTNPQPFQLQTEARGALHQDELAAKLAAAEARARRLRRVTARPLPVTTDVPVVPHKPEPKPLTLPDPFELKSLGRHEAFEEKRRTQLQEDEEAARRAADFKARPLHLGGPFTVHESGAALTVPVDPHLATEERAVERHEFDTHVTERMKHQEEEKQRHEELKRKQEVEATREYRKKLRFSARPMPNFEQPYFAMPSDKPLTNPQTPNFASKKLKKAAQGDHK